MQGYDAGVLIPLVAIVAGMSVPVTAIIVDYKRRRLISEERRAMIEKGMEPPLIEEKPFGGAGDPARLREASLQRGVSSVMLGLGLAFAAWLLQDVITQSFIPRGIVGPLAIGACVLVFLGIGNLVYFALSRNRHAA